jgi:hypothetical protein
MNVQVTNARHLEKVIKIDKFLFNYNRKKILKIFMMTVNNVKSN